MILTNAIRCTKCDTIIESIDRHDFKRCPCKSVAVDGGKDYLRRIGDPENWEEKSTYMKGRVWWCCYEDYPNHAFNCPNYKKGDKC